jgi:CRISPR/Cas system-associated exonuclease Cas4 (RecB family)
MIYSYTQVSHYLACPRKYRYRYVDGWKEKETRPGLLFGRAFEQALAAYFLRQDSTEVLFKEWSAYQSTPLDYSHGDRWDRMLRQGIKLLEFFAQQDRVEIRYTAIIQAAIAEVLRDNETNPRVAGRIPTIRRALESHIAQMREVLQILACQLTVAVSEHKIANFGRSASRRPLGTGSFAEIQLRSPKLHWTGIADLIVRSASGCEITEFKSGVQHEWHREQLEAYALLWAQDSELNPVGKPATKLALIYAGKEVGIDPPTESRLRELETSLRVRTRDAHLNLSKVPPPASPSRENCVFCDVRHLCEPYWSLPVQHLLLPKNGEVCRVTDLQVRVGTRHGPTTWNASVVYASVLNAGAQVLIVVREPSYEQLFRDGTEVRILDSFVEPSVEDGMPITVTLSATTEVFLPVLRER